MLHDRLVPALVAGETASPRDIAVVAMYFPLSSLGQDESLLARAWPDPVGALVAQQLHEPAEERRCRDRLRRLTAIDDPVSAGVRRQYEEHPYPKWVALPPATLISAPDANPGSRFPRALWRAGERRHLDILVAGCGTGQESIEIAQTFPQARVLAVDLSLASLGYAARKAHELLLVNVEHAQADILQLGKLGRTFDVVSSVGVLHHLADPIAGLRELASLLAPDGHLLVGLYSERARGDVVAARSFIAERGYAARADDIRRCRQDLIAANDPRFAGLASRSDFYVTAECRDLLFHMQERRFTLPGIAAVLDALGLRFNGFLLPAGAASRYAKRYPSDPGMENLGNWERLEAEFPGLFAGMYIFWLQMR
jgi:SAM-dependent methyltransferase